MQRFTAYDEVAEVLSAGDTRASVLLKCGLQVDLRVVAQESYGAALHYFTGSKSHNIAIRRIAQQLGLKVNEYGVFRGDRAHRRRQRGIGLPQRRPALHPAGAARRPRRDRGGARRTTAQAGRTLRPERRPACAHQGHRRPRQPARHGAGGQGAGAGVSRHHRALAPPHRRARPRSRCDWRNSATRSTGSTRNSTASRCSRASRWTSSKTAASTCRTTVLARLDLVIGAVHSRFDLSRAQADRAHPARDGPSRTSRCSPIPAGA